MVGTSAIIYPNVWMTEKSLNCNRTAKKYLVMRTALLHYYNLSGYNTMIKYITNLRVRKSPKFGLDFIKQKLATRMFLF